MPACCNVLNAMDSSHVLMNTSMLVTWIKPSRVPSARHEHQLPNGHVNANTSGIYAVCMQAPGRTSLYLRPPSVAPGLRVPAKASSGSATLTTCKPLKKCAKKTMPSMHARHSMSTTSSRKIRTPLGPLSHGLSTQGFSVPICESGFALVCALCLRMHSTPLCVTSDL